MLAWYRYIDASSCMHTLHGYVWRVHRYWIRRMYLGPLGPQRGAKTQHWGLAAAQFLTDQKSAAQRRFCINVVMFGVYRLSSNSINGWRTRWMDGSADEWMDGCIGWMTGEMDGYSMHWVLYTLTCRQIDEWMDGMSLGLGRPHS